MAPDPRTDPRARDLMSAVPDVVSGLVSAFGAVATQAQATADGLRGASADATWTGTAATAFRQGLGKLPRDLGKVTSSYQEAGDALNVYEGELATLKPAFQSIVSQLDNADQQLASAQSNLGTAQIALGAAQARVSQHAISHPLSPVRGLPMNSPLVTAVGAATAAVGNAQSDVAALSARGLQILDEFESARSTATSKISGAGQVPPRPSSWDNPLGIIEDVMATPVIALQDLPGVIWNGVTGTPGAIANAVENPSLASLGHLADDVAVDASVVYGGGVLARAAVGASRGLIVREGSLIIEEGVELSASERRIAQILVKEGSKVVARVPTGIGRTSDFFVNGEPYDVYTPTTGNVNRIVGAIASKNNQVRGGGVIVDLSRSSLTPTDLANVEARVRGITKGVGSVRVIP